MSLLTSRRFGPLFITQFLGAFNDNLYKNALVLLVLYRGFGAVESPGMLVNLAAGLFILPFLLLSASAGQWVDRVDKSRVARVSKWLEVLVVLLGTAGLWSGSLGVSLLALALLGAQSALFGPVKYGVLPQHLAAEELLAGNAWIEAATFIAILLGTLVAGALVTGEQAVDRVSALVLLVAVAGLVAVHGMPPAPPERPTTVDGPEGASAPHWLDPLRATARVLAESRTTPVWPVLLAISWFWAFGATVLTQLPVIVRDLLHGDATLVSVLLAVFSVGVGVGSALAAVVMRRRHDAPIVPAAALGMALSGALWVGGLPAVAPAPATALTPAVWWALPGSAGLVTTLFGLAVAGGVYCVPLYTALQGLATPARRGRAVAANNIVNALAMVAAAGAGSGLLAAGCSVATVLGVVVLGNLPVAWWLWRRPIAKTALT